MEKSQQIVHVVRLHEVRCFQRQVEPFWNCNGFVATNVVSVLLQKVLSHLHVNLISVRIEVKHDRLLEEPVLAVHPGRNLIQILVNSLFQKQAVRVNTVDVRLNVRKCFHSFL
jgi:hypothetical protein